MEEGWQGWGPSCCWLVGARVTFACVSLSSFPTVPYKLLSWSSRPSRYDSILEINHRKVRILDNTLRGSYGVWGSVVTSKAFCGWHHS